MQTTLETLGPARAPPQRRRADRARSKAKCEKRLDAPRARPSSVAGLSSRARCRSRWSRSNTVRRCARTSSPTRVQSSFNDAVREQNLRVAGYPRIEPQRGDERGGRRRSSSRRCSRSIPRCRSATVATIAIERPQVEVTPPDVDRTLDVLRKQRDDVSRRSTRAAQAGDRVTRRLHRHDRRRRIPRRPGAGLSRSCSAKAACCRNSKRR